jgi:FlaA1/EpsC-like NDP-sugar epimerase
MVRLQKALFSVIDRLSRRQKQAALLAVDMVLAPVAMLLSAMVVYHLLPVGAAAARVSPLLLAGFVIAGLASGALGMPQVQLKSYETRAILRTGVLALLVGGGTALLAAPSGGDHPPSWLILFGLIYFLLLVAARVLLLHLLVWALRLGVPQRRVLIYGAGKTGAQLAAALQGHEKIIPVALVDDDPAKHGLMLGGLHVHPACGIAELAGVLGIDRVILAMPSLSAPRQQRIARSLQDAGLSVMSVPSFAQLLGEETLVDALTPLPATQFLGRRRLDGTLHPAASAYAGRVVLVSGAGGSVGSELCRQLIACAPSRLVLLEQSEIALYDIARELDELAAGTGVAIDQVLGSVTDARLVRQVIAQHGVRVVLHAAAYKHVPLVEANPLAGIANNVLGTQTLAEAAAASGVERFVLVSTDKAVRPANVMGATKRVAERVVQDTARRDGRMACAIVRFGNILGSSGSVVPLFRDQIARGGPVTLTHPDVTRYFMTIAEAARLVLLAGSFDRPGSGDAADAYVLDMGRPVRIRDLAEQMIAAAGYTLRDAARPDGDIEIVVTGLRPGEKLHEELVINGDLGPTSHPRILRAIESGLSPAAPLAPGLRILRAACMAGDRDAAVSALYDMVEDHGHRPALVAAQ